MSAQNLSVRAACEKSGKRDRFTLTFPNRFARDEATSMEHAEMTLVTKNIEPSLPSSTLYCERKKKVTQDLDR